MNRKPDMFSPKRHPDLSLAAMILAVGLLIAWAYACARDEGPIHISSGLLPIPAFFGSE